MKVTRNLKANMTSVRMTPARMTPVLLVMILWIVKAIAIWISLDTDMDGDTTDDTYYPFPSNIFALLYMLVKGTQQVETIEYLAPHPLKDKADGKPVVKLPLVLFADDTSGNSSKKWHRFESWYFKLAGLPHGIGPYLNDGELAVWKSFCKVFQIAYSKFFAPSLSDEWRCLCQTFVNTVKQHMPHLLQKQKVHLMLHLVECMHDFGPTSAFNAERFNSKVRAYNVFSNRLSSSRDIAQHFATIQHLRYVCQAHSFSDNERCALGLQRLFSSSFVQHTLCGIAYKELYSDKGIYQPGTPRKVSTCTALFSLPLCVSLRSQTTNLETLQTCEPSYDILLSDVSTTDIVVHYKAIISQESCLINCGDYIEFCSNYQQFTYELLMAVFKTSSGALLCLLQGFKPLCSADGDQRNKYDCPLLELTQSVFTVPSESVRSLRRYLVRCSTKVQNQENKYAWKVNTRVKIEGRKFPGYSCKLDVSIPSEPAQYIAGHQNQRTWGNVPHPSIPP
ncbi:hypothetical protein EMCRGX_G009660 [Ephydatia muelleri]